MTKKCMLGLESPVIISASHSWHCENMDTLAPIDDEGTTYLLSNNETIVIWESERKQKPNNPTIQLLKSLRWATQEERKQFARVARNAIFKGDKVLISRGRKMIGEVKVALNGYKYVVDGTYGRVWTNYLRFEDGTKVNIDHCDVVGIDYVSEFYEKHGKKTEFFYRRFVEDDELDNLLRVGGRY